MWFSLSDANVLLTIVLADDPKDVIINAARRLDHSGVPCNKLGIQFAQIGDDEDATEALQELDVGIAAVNGIRVSAIFSRVNQPRELIWM